MQYLKVVFFADGSLFYATEVFMGRNNEYLAPQCMYERTEFGNLHFWAPAYMLKGEPTEENILAAVLAYHETLKCDTFTPTLSIDVLSKEWFNAWIFIKDPFQKALYAA